MGCIRGTEWGTGGDPVPHKTIILGPKTKLGATAVSGTSGTFAEEQTLFGHGGENAPPSPFLGEGGKVRFGVGGENRELEPTLAFSFSVAPRRIASIPPQNGQDV